jgi:hypothetical protein
MERLDPNDATNYRCVLAKNGAHQYFFGTGRIAIAKIPKQVLPAIICPQKGEALVSERTQAFEQLRTGVPALEKKAERLKKAQAKREEKKAEARAVTAAAREQREAQEEEEEETEEEEARAQTATTLRFQPRPLPKPPQRQSPPRQASSASNGSRSPPKRSSPKKTSPKRVQIGGERARSPAGKAPAKTAIKTADDKPWLSFFWTSARQLLNEAQIEQLVREYEAESGGRYPYGDRNAILTGR